jgi:hypothetical protein
MAKLDSLLTYEEAKQVFIYDSETGYIRQRGSKFNTAPNQHGYLHVSWKNKRLKCHRVVWLLHNGAWPKNQIDHINRNRADNRIENLRDVPRRINSANKINNALMVGTTWHPDKKKWKAKIQVNNKSIHLGYFNTQEEASQRYQQEVEVICATLPQH